MLACERSRASHLSDIIFYTNNIIRTLKQYNKAIIMKGFLCPIIK